MARKNLAERRYWREAFKSVIDYYHEGRRQTALSCTGFYVGLQSEAGKATSKAKPTGPSESDFNCDVALAARRYLKADELKYFVDYFIEQDGSTTTDKERNRVVAEKLGRGFIERGIHPVDIYFKGRLTK